MSDTYEQFHWGLGNAISYGPDFTEELKDRHCQAVRKIAKEWAEPEGDFLDLRIDSDQAGRFFDDEVKPGPSKPSYSRKYREASIRVGFVLEDIHLDDEQFRILHSRYLLDGTSMLLKYLEKLRVRLDYVAVTKRVEEIVRRYNQLAFPLPASPHEANTASWYEARRLFEEHHHTANLPAFSKVSFYIYFKTKRACTGFGESLIEQSYECEVSGEGKSWLCLATKNMSNREVLEAEELRIGNLAADAGGDLDGWDVE